MEILKPPIASSEPVCAADCTELANLRKKMLAQYTKPVYHAYIIPPLREPFRAERHKRRFV